MKIIVALGNPGEKYELTRHNAGWLALDDFLRGHESPAASCTKFNSELVEAAHGTQKIFFVKPQTFMNDSGKAVAEIVNFYKTEISKDLLVVHDDVDLPLGTIRFTSSSSAAGHNGIKDIIEKLGTQDFCRIRIGVESRESKDQIPTDTFVLQNFTGDELQKFNKEIFPKITEQIKKFIET